MVPVLPMDAIFFVVGWICGTLPGVYLFTRFVLPVLGKQDDVNLFLLGGLRGARRVVVDDTVRDVQFPQPAAGATHSEASASTVLSDPGAPLGTIWRAVKDQ